MRPSRSHSQHSAIAAKQVAQWRCESCRRHCRRPGESLDGFINRTKYNRATVIAHPRRWVLVLSHLRSTHEATSCESVSNPVVLCTPCHRTYLNQQMATLKRLKRERQGQLTLQDIAVPLQGQQLALGELAQPYVLHNALPRSKR